MAENKGDALIETGHLLDEVEAIQGEYPDKKENGQLFNLFELFHAAGSETKVCRVMKELLDPYGRHGQGSVYLDLFCKIVLHQYMPTGEVRIRREFRISDTDCTGQEERRIDLVIQAKNCFWAIEVKIYAEDQLAQCRDYLLEVAKKNGQLYYLTLHGTMPSWDSLNPQSDQVRKLMGKFHRISFQDHILRWLQVCRETMERRRVLSMVLVLEQFMDAVRRWTGQMDEETMALKHFLQCDTQRLVLADKIDKALLEVKKGILSQVMDGFAGKIKESVAREYGLVSSSDLNVEGRYTQNQDAFYDSLGRGGNLAHFGRYWRVEDVYLGKNYELYFSIEVECNLYAQFLIYVSKEKAFYTFKDFQDKDFDNKDKAENEDREADEETVRKIKVIIATVIKAERASEEHPDWEYLSLLGEKPIDLKHYQNIDRNLLKLCDKNVLDKSVAENMENITDLLKRVRDKFAAGDKRQEER
jgi:hypothetical protein